MSYMMTKKIPVEVPLQLLNEADLFSIEALIPTETYCHICQEQPILNDPLLITSNGTLVTLQGVRKGIIPTYGKHYNV